MAPPNTPKALSAKQLLAIVGATTFFQKDMAVHLVNLDQDLPKLNGIVNFICTSINKESESVDFSLNLVTRIRDVSGQDVNPTDHPGLIVDRFLAALQVPHQHVWFGMFHEGILRNLAPPGFIVPANSSSLTITKLIEAWFKHANIDDEYPEGTFGAQFVKDVLRPMQNHAQVSKFLSFGASTFILS